jgi:hypothetical protein
MLFCSTARTRRARKKRESPRFKTRALVVRIELNRILRSRSFFSGRGFSRSFGSRSGFFGRGGFGGRSGFFGRGGFFSRGGVFGRGGFGSRSVGRGRFGGRFATKGHASGASRDEGKSKEFLHFFFLLSCVKHISKTRLGAKTL